jgi:GAF domain-containing protein
MDALPLVDAVSGAPNLSRIAADVVHSGTTINIENTQAVPQYQYTAFATGDHDYHSKSVLALPLKNVEGRVLGVLQLSDAHDPVDGELIAFDDNLQQMMESFSSLAVAALEAYVREQALRQEIRQLRVEIDESRKTEQVQEIVDSDFFAELQSKAHMMRQRKSQRRTRKSADS